MKTRQEGFKEPLLMALRSGEEILGTFLPAAKTICFRGPPCFSPAQHWPPTCAFLVEQKDTPGRVEELPDPIRQDCTSFQQRGTRAANTHCVKESGNTGREMN